VVTIFFWLQFFMELEERVLGCGEVRKKIVPWDQNKKDPLEIKITIQNHFIAYFSWTRKKYWRPSAQNFCIDAINIPYKFQLKRFFVANENNSRNLCGKINKTQRSQWFWIIFISNFTDICNISVLYD
jgi:hypothetical protein